MHGKRYKLAYWCVRSTFYVVGAIGTSCMVRHIYIYMRTYSCLLVHMHVTMRGLNGLEFFSRTLACSAGIKAHVYKYRSSTCMHTCVQAHVYKYRSSICMHTCDTPKFRFLYKLFSLYLFYYFSIAFPVAPASFDLSVPSPMFMWLKASNY